MIPIAHYFRILGRIHDPYYQIFEIVGLYAALKRLEDPILHYA